MIMIVMIVTIILMAIVILLRWYSPRVYVCPFSWMVWPENRWCLMLMVKTIDDGYDTIVVIMIHIMMMILMVTVKME